MSPEKIPGPPEPSAPAPPRWRIEYGPDGLPVRMLWIDYDREKPEAKETV